MSHYFLIKNSLLKLDGTRVFWLLLLLSISSGFDAAVAQTAHPFATPEQRLNIPSSGWFAEFSGQMAAWQGYFYRQLTGAVRAWKQDGWAAWLLLALSFGYGVFHALGPGHGKAVLTAYVLANRETIRNGALLAMLSAFLQAFVAIALVAVAAGILQVSGVAMNRATWWLELVSYAMMAALGAWLVYRHVFKPFIDWLRAGLVTAQSATISFPPHTHSTLHAHHAEERIPHVHSESCGHVHVPDPALVAGPLNWSKATSAIFAVGLRPCSGAIFVLVFSLAQGFFFAGIAAALAMGLGTGLTVAAMACASLWVSQATVSVSGGPKKVVGKIVLAGVQALASMALLILGVMLLSAAIASSTAGF